MGGDSIMKKEKHFEHHCYYFQKTIRLGPGPWKNPSREEPELAQRSVEHLALVSCPADLPSRTVTDLPSHVGNRQCSMSARQVPVHPPSHRVLAPRLGSRSGGEQSTVTGQLAQSHAATK